MRFSITLAASFAALAPGCPQAAAQERAEEAAEGEDIVVQATRGGRRVQDEPIRVEVIDREEIEEKIMMTPGNISMLVAETGGVRVQMNAPALGTSSVRMQGMKGRYTSILSDGLPLYGGQASSIGLLQIPPTDLGQVEIIKGAASALYGPAALGGVINLVSRRPGDAAQAELLANVTSRGGRDLTGYAAAPIGGGWSASVTSGHHRQRQQDLDDDGWADMPGYERSTVRPRLFWEGDDGASLYATIGAMAERRVGGTLAGRVTPDGRPFVQAQDARRFDAGLVVDLPVSDAGTLHLRGSATTQDHRHRFGEVTEDDCHHTVFVEASFGSERGGTSWLGGVAIQRDTYRSRTFPAFDYTHSVPGVFGQVEHEATDRLTLAGSARLDVHNVYGTRASPRLSALYKPGRFTVRASLGRGFYAPTPFIEDIEDSGLSRLAPLSRLRAETADTASIDAGYKRGGLEANVALFVSHLHNAVRLENVAGGVRLVNATGLSRTQGIETLLRYRWDAFVVTASYVRVDASEENPDGAGRRRVPLTPRDTAGIVAMWEKPGRARVGFEAYYTGPQALEDNPYRDRSRSYVEIGVLGEMTLGKVSLFVNGENLLGARQTRYDPLVRRARAADGRWTVDAWAPLEGRVVNGGVRLRFGGRE